MLRVAHRPFLTVLQPACHCPSGKPVSSWPWLPPDTPWARWDRWSWRKWRCGADEHDSDQLSSYCWWAVGYKRQGGEKGFKKNHYKLSKHQHMEIYSVSKIVVNIGENNCLNLADVEQFTQSLTLDWHQVGSNNPPDCRGGRRWLGEGSTASAAQRTLGFLLCGEWFCRTEMSVFHLLNAQRGTESLPSL